MNVPPRPGVDFYKEIYTLRFPKFSIVYICALRPNIFVFSQIWVRFTLKALRPTFMKSTPGRLEDVCDD
jgi:hypothetical protein